jgi:hypothetical protein
LRQVLENWREGMFMGEPLLYATSGKRNLFAATRRQVWGFRSPNPKFIDELDDAYQKWLTRPKGEVFVAQKTATELTNAEQSKSEPEKETAVRPVELRGRGQAPVVRGQQKKRPLTVSQYDVVGVLLTAGPKGLSKDELIKVSKHADAIGILRRLANGDNDWRAVIKFPGSPGVGYRIG